MPPNPIANPLPLEIKLPQFADLAKVEAAVSQYAAALCADLGLPAAVTVSLTGLPRQTWSETELVSIVAGGRPCRSRWWPQPFLPEQPSVQDVAALIGLALYQSREFLLTSDLARSIATDWGAADANGYRNGWSPGAFLSFLRAFAKYNFSLRHARAFVCANPDGTASESEAAYLFEQAIEQTSELVLGIRIAICPEECSAQYRPEYEKFASDLAKDLNSRFGLICPPVRVESGPLLPGEFQIQLNDIHLPVIRGLARTEIVILRSKSEVTKHGIETFELFDPLLGSWFLCGEDSPEIVTKISPDFLAGPSGFLKNSALPAMAAIAGSLLTSPIVHLLLENLRNAQDLVKDVRTHFGVPPLFQRRLTMILRRLLDEQVSIANLVGILDSLLSLREVIQGGERISVYHFSELEDSPILVAEGQAIAELDIDACVFAARLGVRSLAVRNQETVRLLLPVLPLAPSLASRLASRSGDEVLSEQEGKQIIELLNSIPKEKPAVVVSQSLRARVREHIRCEFPEVPVLGSSEVPKHVLALGYQALSRALYELKRYEEALEAISMAKSLQPEEVPYHFELGRIYDALNRTQEATAEYRLAARVVNDPAWREEIANTFRQRGAFKEAIRLYRELTQLDPASSTYFSQLGNCLYETGAYRRAIDAYSRASQLAPHQALIHANLGYALTFQGDYVSSAARKRRYWTEGLQELQQAIELNPDIAWFHDGMHVPLRRLRRLDDAVIELREAIRLDEKNVSSRLSLARCLSQQDKFAEAVQELEASRTAFPSVLEIQMELARAYAQADDYQKAVATLDAVNSGDTPPKEAAEFLMVLRGAQEVAVKLAADPKNAELYAALGTVQARIGNLRAAAGQYRRAASLDLSKPNLEYRRLLGNTLYKLDDYEGAIQEWEIVCGLAPEEPLTHNNLGTAYDGLDQPDRAQECYAQAAALAPNQFVPRYNLGSSNYRMGRIEEARDAYMEAVRLHETFAPAHLNLGNCYEKLRERDLAIVEWEKASNLDGTLIEALFNLGVGMWAVDDGSGQARTKAVDNWKKALALDPNLTDAEDNLDAVEFARKVKGPGQPEHLEIFDLVHTRGSEDPPSRSAGA